MWLYLPSSVSVPDTEESNLDYQPWETLSQSATLKATSRKPQFLQREFKKDSSLTALSGVTLKPSTANRGVELWISSLEAFRASPGPLPERNLERMTQDTSGPMSQELSGNSTTQLSFWKTSQESLSPTTTLSDQSYRQWVTPLRKDSLQRRKQAHHTGGKDFLSLVYMEEMLRHSWPTPTQRDYKGGSPGTVVLKNNRLVRVSDSTGETFNLTLDTASTIWPNFPTPNTMDHMAPRTQEGMEKLFTGHRKGRTAPSNLREYIQPEMHTPGWRTPSANDNNGGVEDWSSERFQNLVAPRVKLNHQAANWATPAARDYKGFDSPGKQHPAKDPLLYLSIHPDPQTGKDGHTCSVKCRRLSPTFVSLVMGLPPNWSNSLEVTAMGSYRRWRLSLGATLLRLLFKESL